MGKMTTAHNGYCLKQRFHLIITEYSLSERYKAGHRLSTAPQAPAALYLYDEGVWQ